jgi:hypothetical protein
MHLRNAVLRALQFDAWITYPSRPTPLRVAGPPYLFLSAAYRSKYACGAAPEERVSATEVLRDDWYLVKDGKRYELPEPHLDAA